MINLNPLNKTIWSMHKVHYQSGFLYFARGGDMVDSTSEIFALVHSINIEFLHEWRKDLQQLVQNLMMLS